MFVSMDVVFRENEPFYGEPTDLTDVFPDLFSNDISDAECAAGGEREEKDNNGAYQEVIIGLIPAEDTNTSEIEQIQGQEGPQDTL